MKLRLSCVILSQLMKVHTSAHISEISLGRGKKWSFMMYDTTSEVRQTSVLVKMFSSF